MAPFLIADDNALAQGDNAALRPEAETPKEPAVMRRLPSSQGKVRPTEPVPQLLYSAGRCLPL